MSPTDRAPPSLERPPPARAIALARGVGQALGGAGGALLAGAVFDDPFTYPMGPSLVAVGGALAGLAVVLAVARFAGELASTRRARWGRIAVGGVLTPGLALAGYCFFEVAIDGPRAPAGGSILSGAVLVVAVDLLGDFPGAVVLTAITFAAAFPLADASWRLGCERRAGEAWEVPFSVRMVWGGVAGGAGGLLLWAACRLGGVWSGPRPFVIPSVGAAFGTALGDTVGTIAAERLGWDEDAAGAPGPRWEPPA